MNLVDWRLLQDLPEFISWPQKDALALVHEKLALLDMYNMAGSFESNSTEQKPGTLEKRFVLLPSTVRHITAGGAEIPVRLPFLLELGVNIRAVMWTRGIFSSYTFTEVFTNFATCEMADEVKVTDRFSLTGKNFLITGGGRGIGFAVAKSIAQLGGGVAILDFLQQPVDEFHTLGKKYGIKTSYHQCDVTKQESLESAFTDAVTKMSQIHGGLCAAGIALDEKLVEADWKNSQKILDVNVLGTFWTAKLIAKHLIDTKTPGSIVMIASVSGHGIHIPVQAATIYNASKAAVKGMVGPLAVELGPYNIRVNSISPGAIFSPMTQSLEVENPAILSFFKDAAPVGRIGQTDDLTPMVCYLLSDASGFSTGADHLITGGIHAGRCDHIRKSTAVTEFMTTENGLS